MNKSFTFALLVILAGFGYAAPQQADAQSASVGSTRARGFAGLTRRKDSPVELAIAAFKDAESSDDKDKAESDLREALEDEYERLMDDEEKQLEELEDRLNELRRRLQKRRDAKRTMVDHRLMTLIQDANGLGWPSERSGRTRWSSFPGALTIAPSATSPPVPVPAPTAPALPAVPGRGSR